jgi:L-threonylcarbamoyladenylate synthase
MRYLSVSGADADLSLAKLIDKSIAEAAAVLSAGGLVAFPTETVYGLGGDAFNQTALAKIFDIKRRPRFDPLIIHIAALAALDRIADLSLLDRQARRKLDLLSRKLWPGPLTIILPKRKEVPDLATSGLPTAAIRFPDHPVAQKLISLSTGAVAAPSANPFGYLSPTRAEHVRDQLGDAVDIILDGGPSRVGVESTVLDLSSGLPRILRHGGTPREEIEALIGKVVVGSAAAEADAEAEITENASHCAVQDAVNSDVPQFSPGQLKSHYAPRTPLVIHPYGEMLSEGKPLSFGKPENFPLTPNEGRLYFSGRKMRNENITENVRILSMTGNMIEAAANLFEMLHELDSLGLKVIHAEEVPSEGLGAAINDRLQRAEAKTAGAE